MMLSCKGHTRSRVSGRSYQMVLMQCTKTLRRTKLCFLKVDHLVLWSFNDH